MCENISEDVNEDVAQCFLDKALSMMHDHGDNGHGYEGEGTWIRDSRDTGRNVACTENIVPTDVTACTQWRSNYGHEEIVDFKVLANYEGKQEESSVWVVSDQGDDEEGEYLVSGDWYVKEGSGAIMWREDITPNDDWWNEGDDDDHDHDHDHDHDYDMIFYCTNDGEDYASEMGGIVCPEGPNVQPMCPNNEPCYCIDTDGSCEDGDDDWGYPEEDDAALLDGIVGIQDPQDAGDDCRPSAQDSNMLGKISDNEDKPLRCSFDFKINFEGVDESLKTHVAYIPFQDEEKWTLVIEMFEAYEFIKCDNCNVDDNGVMTGSGSVNVTFGKVEEEKDPQPDCDHTIGLDSTGMAFDPVKLSIKAGETVCWQWKDAAMAHNVLELEGEYDSTMNLTNINFGFSSGEPSVTVDFRHTFTKDNMTHYYVCEPHASTGMVGQITVGEGSEDDPVQQAIDDNEVPSIGFVVGSLVLVGAAGLRRRIH